MSMSYSQKKKASKQSTVTLRDYQRHVVDKMLANETHGIFLRPGLGKTLCSLQAFHELKQAGEVDYMLVVAPLRVAHGVWEQEVKKWAYPYSVGILHGKDKEETLYGDYDIQVINYEGLEWLAEHVVSDPSLQWDMLVLDESTKIKNNKTNRFKLVKLLAEKFSRRYILTGTPSPNSLMDLWSQIYILDSGAALGKYITHFRNAFFYPSGFNGYTWELKDGADKKIYSRLKSLVTHVGEEVLDLPEVVVDIEKLSLPTKAQCVYYQIEKELFAQLDAGEISVANAAVKTMKLRQIANGGIYTDEKQTIHVHDTKAQAAIDYIEEVGGEPVLVGYEFKHDLERIKKRLPKSWNVGYVYSGMPPSKFKKLQDDWNAGKYRVLVGQISAIAHGLNLQNSCHHLLIHSLVWSLEDYDQLIKRLHRSGQSKRVYVRHLVMTNTVDLAVLAGLKGKARTQKALLAALRSYRRAN